MDDPLPKNFWTARQRLSKLRKYALLKTEKVLSNGKAHFLLTSLGEKIVKDYRNQSAGIKPTRSIDFSLYEHDMRASMLRVFLEKKGKVKAWYSEKWLKRQCLLCWGIWTQVFKRLEARCCFCEWAGGKDSP